MISRVIHNVVSFFKIISGVMLILMMVVTCADVVGNMFGYPILGSEELVGIMASILLAFALPFAHREKAHIGVELLYQKFPEKAKKINDGVIELVSSVFFLLVAWQCWGYGGQLRQTGQVSAVLELPTYYILYSVSIACFLLFMVIFAEFFSLTNGEKK
ncbi:MAG: TRAP transporter small permease [Desulfobacteraceae bacterium]